MVNTRQFSGSTYMQDMTKSHTFSAKNQGSTYTPIRLIRREIRYKLRQVRYYKLRRILLQIATGITICDNRYYNCKLRHVLQIATLLQIATVHSSRPTIPPPPIPQPPKVKLMFLLEQMD